MAEDPAATASNSGHGGTRRGASRPRGSKNKPKKQPPGSSVPSGASTRLHSERGPPASIKPADKIISGPPLTSRLSPGARCGCSGPQTLQKATDIASVAHKAIYYCRQVASGKKNATGNGGQWEAASGDLQPAGSRKHAEASGVRRTAGCGQRELQVRVAGSGQQAENGQGGPGRRRQRGPGVARGTSRKAGSRRATAAGSGKGGRMRRIERCVCGQRTADGEVWVLHVAYAGGRQRPLRGVAGCGQRAAGLLVTRGPAQRVQRAASRGMWDLLDDDGDGRQQAMGGGQDDTGGGQPATRRIQMDEHRVGFEASLAWMAETDASCSGLHGGLVRATEVRNGTATYRTGSERLESTGTLCSARARLEGDEIQGLGHVDRLGSSFSEADQCFLNFIGWGSCLFGQSSPFDIVLISGISLPAEYLDFISLGISGVRQRPNWPSESSG
ncbi:hypothetical protein GGX14DRAFT_397081 [Mycena pura]|uniref:Uncharacterized protein n=1 Tax=Mycena pura TaxID=153505 RepID=A0AAD6V9C7_9AGAR|nr:hypothetical protein GGX14DRAFT_397081 [Mycena pura]